MDSYAIIKSKINRERGLLREGLDRGEISLDSISNYFTKALTEEIIPYWYGTTWSFEGHTETPGRGEVACGYFISTTLRDMGVELNRYKLAQKAPLDEAKFLSSDSEIMNVSNSDVQEAIEEIKCETINGVYFIGFDSSHVGYLVNDNDNLFLIHSNYMAPYNVLKEKVEVSDVFKSFNNFYVLPISTNKGLINKWLNQLHIK